MDGVQFTPILPLLSMRSASLPEVSNEIVSFAGNLIFVFGSLLCAIASFMTKSVPSNLKFPLESNVSLVTALPCL